MRPEHFQLDPNGLPAKVHVVEPTGSETQVLADFAGASVLCAFRERVSAKPGETIRITPTRHWCICSMPAPVCGWLVEPARFT